MTMLWITLGWLIGVVTGWAFVLWIVQLGLNRGILVIAKGPEWEDRFDYKTWSKRNE